MVIFKAYNADEMGTEFTKTPLTPAEHARAYRGCQRYGDRIIPVCLEAVEIESLVAMGLLNLEQRQDREAIGYALRGFLDSTMGDRKVIEKITRAMSPVEA